MITGYFGLPGCGKTTYLTMLAQKELKKIEQGKSKYKRVLTNYYCDNCYKIDYKDLGHYEITDCLILLDEITLDADSRNFKQFDHFKKQFFLLHRHYNCDIVYFTQQWDGVDKKIRDITQNLYYCKKIGSFTKAKIIFRCVEINEFSKEIVTGYRFPTFLENIFNCKTKWCYRPKYYEFFDSWEKPKDINEIKSFERWVKNEED